MLAPPHRLRRGRAVPGQGGQVRAGLALLAQGDLGHDATPRALLRREPARGKCQLARLELRGRLPQPRARDRGRGEGPPRPEAEVGVARLDPRVVARDPRVGPRRPGRSGAAGLHQAAEEAAFVRVWGGQRAEGWGWR